MTTALAPWVASDADACTPSAAAAAWQRLEAELSRWADAGTTTTLWWRDDDAVAPGPALSRLIALTGRHAIPLTVAVIPRDATEALATALTSTPHATVSQHGWSHTDHAPAGQKKAELGDHRPLDAVIADIDRGADRLDALFGRRPRWLTPPWNRIADGVPPRLDPARFLGVSGFGARPSAGGRMCNTHVDPIDWKGRHGPVRSSLSETLILDPLIDHLAARRLNRIDPTEPTGLLTHHRDHDARLWRFLEALTDRLSGDPRVRWVGPQAACRVGDA